MKTLLMSPEFRAELPGWTLRGVLGAASSACWAVTGGFSSPVEVAGMIAGIAVWVAIFAWGCGWVRRHGRWNQTQIVAALKRASWIKLGLTAVGWTIMVVAGASGNETAMASGMLAGTDVLLGLVALGFVSLLSGMDGAHAVARADSFGWTALATVTEGLLVALLIALIAIIETQLHGALQKRSNEPGA